MFFLAPFDPYAPGAYAVQDTFTHEFMRPDHSRFALFACELESREHFLVLVAPSLSEVPATALAASWQEAHELPKAKWRLLTGDNSAWETFNIPRPSAGRR